MADERRVLAKRVEAGPQQDRVCSLRGVDFQKFVQQQFGKLLSLTTVYRLLHDLGYEWLVLRPKHRKSDLDAVGEFKKIPAAHTQLEVKHPQQQTVVFFQDECSFDQQGALMRGWARRGSRPTLVRQTEYN